jgi:Sulfotransferase family
MAASRRLPYIYVQNSKCASSTIRNTLWAAEHALGLTGPPGRPHNEAVSAPLVHDPRRWEQVEREFVFTVARNPFTRILSAYLDKIVAHRDPRVWGTFAARHGLPEAPLAFRDFLQLVADTPEDEMDQHWRPQSCGLAPTIVPYDFIGGVESLQADLAHILQRIFGADVPIREFMPHRTNSSRRVAEHYGAEEIRLVRRIYAADFAQLGYSQDPAITARTPTGGRPDPELIQSWGRAWRLVEEGAPERAAVELEALQDRISGPLVDERLLRCRCAISGRAAKAALADDLRRLEPALERGYGDWATWKWYGAGLRRLGRHEDGLQAEILALEKSASRARVPPRLERLRWRLALLRASKGRAAEAQATLASAPWWWRAFLRAVSAVASVARAPRWHPDRALGIPRTDEG